MGTFEKNTSAFVGAFHGDQYVSSVNQEINNLTSDMNSFKGFSTNSSALKGDIAEFWHSGTHNIDATIKGINISTTVDRSHNFASADITSSEGSTYGLKYYATGVESAKAQSVSIFQRYSEYKATSVNSGRIPDSLEMFLKKRGYNDTSVISDPIYSGQIRIIPKDQMQEAIDWLNRKIAKEASSRPDQIQRYQETLNMLNDKVCSSKGSESIPITSEEAKKLAELAKEGAFNPADFGLTTEELIKYRYIMQQAFKAGLTAATISMVLRVAPEIFKAIEHLFKHGELDEKQFQKIGFSALTGATEGLFRGTVSAAITTACKAGLWGEALKSVNPAIVGTITAIAMDVMKNSFSVVGGKMSRGELVDSLIKNMYISSCSLLIGGVVQNILIDLPVFGFMLGSFVGSMIGSFAYSMSSKTYLSFCIDTGFAMFGIVDQNYTLPKDILKNIGLDVFEYETFDYEKFKPIELEPNTFSANTFSANTINITVLRRGVIGVNQIGYV